MLSHYHTIKLSNFHTITLSYYYTHTHTHYHTLSHYHIHTACLRAQVNPENSAEFKTISPERAFADFIFCHVVLHLVVMNFIG